MKRSILILIAFLVAFVLLYPNHATAAGLQKITVSAASFQPTNDHCYFINGGTSLNAGSLLDNGCSYFIAPLQLPVGVTIQKITFYWNDNNVEDNASLKLRSANLTTGISQDLGTVPTHGFENIPTSSYIDTSILVSDAPIGYHLVIIMPPEEVAVYGVVIEYSFLTSLPEVIRH